MSIASYIEPRVDNSGPYLTSIMDTNIICLIDLAANQRAGLVTPTSTPNTFIQKLRVPMDGLERDYQITLQDTDRFAVFTGTRTPRVCQDSL